MNRPVHRMLLVLSLIVVTCAAIGATLGLPARALGDPPPVTGLVSPSHPLDTKWYGDPRPTFRWRGLSPAATIAGYSYAFDQDQTTVPAATVSLPALSFEVVSNTTAVSSLYFATGDLNGDGRSDVAFGMWNKIEVRLARTNGTLGAAHAFAVTRNARPLAVGEVNGGGKPDIVVASSFLFRSGAFHVVVGVLLGRGNGSFRAPRDYDLGSFAFANPSAVAIRDLNGDGKPDILVAVGTKLVVLLGNGNGTFGRERVSNADAGDTQGDLGYMTTLAFADINGDGRVDVVAGGQENDNMPAGLLSIALGEGDGRFRSLSTADSGELLPAKVVFADLAHNGKQDLIVQYDADGDDWGGPDYTVLTVARGNGRGSFAKPTDYDLLPQEGDPPLVAADFNRDGNLDLAIGTSAGLDVLLGNGDGSFQQPVTFGPGPDRNLTVGGDFDGDGRPDVLGESGGSAESVFLDRSAGAAYTGIADGIWYFHVRAVDANGVGGPTSTRAVRIDTHAPTARAPEPAMVKSGEIARLTYIVDDPSPCAGWCTVRIVVTDRRGRVQLVLHVNHARDGATSHVAFRCRLAKGKYYLHVRATDPAGNRSKVASDALFVR